MIDIFLFNHVCDSVDLFNCKICLLHHDHNSLKYGNKKLEKKKKEERNFAGLIFILGRKFQNLKIKQSYLSNGIWRQT